VPSLLKIFLRSGPCWDSPAFLRFYLAALRNPPARLLLLALRVKFSPQVLENIRRSGLPAEEKGRLFSGAMNLFRAGGAYKTTAPFRSPLTDSAMLGKVPPGGLLAETGASDGSSSLGLLEAARGAEVMLTDLQASFPYRDTALGRVFYNTDGRYTALKTLCLYLCSGGASSPAAADGEISLLNPLVEEKFPAARLLPLDIFSGELERKADALKCANVLNLEYFTAGEIKRALQNLRRSLKEGGWLFICHNNARYKDGEAWVALQRSGEKMRLKEEANGHELLPLLRSTDFSDLTG